MPVWMTLVGCFVAVVIAKMAFGGLGKNVFNPALVGRVFLFISFPVQMTSWPKPDFLNFLNADVETGATTLGILKHIDAESSATKLTGSLSELPDYWQMFVGHTGGRAWGGLGPGVTVSTGAASRFCLAALAANHYLAHSFLLCCNSLHLYKYYMAAYRQHSGRTDNPAAFRRTAARRNFYGNRLCYDSDEPQRTDRLCRRLRHSDRHYPPLERLSRRRFFRHPDYERFCSADRLLYRSARFWHREKINGRKTAS